MEPICHILIWGQRLPNAIRDRITPTQLQLPQLLHEQTLHRIPTSAAATTEAIAVAAVDGPLAHVNCLNSDGIPRGAATEFVVEFAAVDVVVVFIIGVVIIMPSSAIEVAEQIDGSLMVRVFGGGRGGEGRGGGRGKGRRGKGGEWVGGESGAEARVFDVNVNSLRNLFAALDYVKETCVAVSL